MKKKPLTLRRETVRNLAAAEMPSVNGGAYSKSFAPWNCASQGADCTATNNCPSQQCTFGACGTTTSVINPP